MVFDDHGNGDCRHPFASIALSISWAAGHFVDILLSQHPHIYRSIIVQSPQIHPVAGNYLIDAAASRSIPFLVLPFGDVFDSRGAVPMGLETITIMLIYVSAPLSSEFVRFVQVLFWTDVVLSLLCCFAIPLFMYITPAQM